MTLQEEILKIKNDLNLDYKTKAECLLKLITKQELDAILPKPEEEAPKLKEPLKPKTKGMKILNLSIHDVYFEQIKQGTKKIEYRDYTNDYYVKKCTYTENGKRYLVPFDALTLYVGRQKSMTVALTDITCNGVYLMFHLGEILYPKG